MSSAERRKIMAEMLQSFPDLAESGTIALGYMLRDILLHQIADDGTTVDTGAGMGEFDLWVKMDGREYVVTVKPSKQGEADDEQTNG